MNLSVPGSSSPRTIVIKYGGSLLEDLQKNTAVLKDIAAVSRQSNRVIVVHGGGKHLEKFLRKTGYTPRFIEGRRVTDQTVLKAAEMVFCGAVNKELVGRLWAEKIRPVGLSGKDGGLLECRKTRQENLGEVGEITKVNGAFLKLLLEQKMIPVIASVGTGPEGQSYNINADEAALAIALALRSDELIFLTDINGVCLNPEDPETLIPLLTASSAEALMEDGSIRGGMLPKIRSCLEALEAGVGSIHIADGRKKNLLPELLQTGTGGTRILKETKEARE